MRDGPPPSWKLSPSATTVRGANRATALAKAASVARAVTFDQLVWFNRGNHFEPVPADRHGAAQHGVI